MTSPQQSPSQDDLKQQQREALRKAALEYHEFPTPGKISVTPTKPLSNQRDLALAYSPGVAARARKSWPIRPIRSATPRGQPGGRDHQRHRRAGWATSALAASKPVMEGKAVLFKKFAGIDVFDIEVDEKDPTSWSTSSPRSSRPSAASTSKTSRRRSASTSSASCASG
jgi:malate dehydrogenase (oxaloacetate-decarboxylating)(NADP+)